MDHPTTETSAALAACLDALGHRPAAIEDVWLDQAGMRLHLDFHRATDARAVLVFHPGSGSYARCYAELGRRLAAVGVHVLGIDRPGHGFSDGPRGDCTIDQALEVTATVLDHAHRRFGLPVVLMGSSLGGLITGFAVMAGLRADLAIAHNFLIPGRLVSLRLRGRFIERFRRKPYPLRKLVHGFTALSRHDGMRNYLAAEADPQAAWALSPHSVASLFRHNPRPVAPQPCPLALISGSADPAIPAWASRLFLRWSGLRDTQVLTLPGAGHMLFHDDLERTMPLVERLIDGLSARTAVPSLPLRLGVRQNAVR